MPEWPHRLSYTGVMFDLTFYRVLGSKAYFKLTSIQRRKSLKRHKKHKDLSDSNDVSILPKLCGLTQEFLRFTVGWKTWQCWKPPSPASRVSSETASPLCRKPRTGVSAPLSTLGGATAGLRMSTLMLPGNTQLKKSSYLIVIVLSRNHTNLFHIHASQIYML